ncbi:iron complex transport system permease protein [Fontibacillus phaseoli]|uniref:Iron complex transport system permease protein n=1 Tax=Fontibacillus phaseoli TaxID=1416533 RepID=A0A369BF40_9BACL|nr:iron complex transport system permease protein [Fontibacillus phaseoli]
MSIDLSPAKPEAGTRQKRTSRGSLLLVFVAGPVILALLLCIQITQGTAGISLPLIREALFHPVLDDPLQQIVRGVRLPRALIGALAGAALSVAGVLLQTLTRNPLASAGTLGINAGAYLAVVAATIFFPSLMGGFPLLTAMAGGMLAGAIVFLMAGQKRSAPVRLALGGMSLTLVLSSLTGTLQLLFENETAGLFLWGSGSLIQNDWHNVATIWPWVLGGLLLSVLFSRNLDILLMDDEVGKSLGQRIGLTRTVSVLTAVLLAAVTVSAVGPIGFVGLIAPHLLRLMGLHRHRLLIPGAAIWGAIVLVAADLAVLLLEPAFGLLPAGSATAALGAPWLIWLVYRMKPSRGDVQGATSGMGAGFRRALPYPALLAGAGLLLLLALGAGLVFGGKTVPLPDVWAALTGEASKITSYMVIETRLPRLLVAALAGASLAVSGTLLQGVVRNPLADPSVIGVTSGAGLGALIFLILLPQLPGSLVPAAAFTGALGAALVIFAISRKGGMQPAKVALIGMAVSAFGSAGIQALVVKAQLRVASALTWLSGSTYARGWDDLGWLFIWPLVLLPLAWWLARRLDLLALGDASAINLGVSAERTRLLGGLLGAALAASAVATVGTVGFVGLLAPHAARLLVPNANRKLTVLSALLGAVFLVLADIVGRVLLAPKEIPSGLVVALLGAPYFLWLMRSAGTRSTSGSK